MRGEGQSALLTVGVLAPALVSILGGEPTHPPADSRVQGTLGTAPARVEVAVSTTQTAPPEARRRGPAAVEERAVAEATTRLARATSAPAVVTGQLLGKVWDSRLRPVTDASLRVVGLPKGPVHTPAVSNQGTFSLRAQPGRYRVTAAAPGRTEQSIDVLLSETHEVRVALRLPRAATLELHAPEAQPDSVREAVVQSRHGHSEARVARRRRSTFSVGAPVRLEGLDPGIYRARLVTRTGSNVQLGPWSEPLRVDGGKTQTLELLPGASPLPSVCGRVSLPEGCPPTRLTLRVGDAKVETDLHGAFSVGGLPKAVTALEVTTPGYALAQGPTAFDYDGAPATPLVVRVVPLVEVSGHAEPGSQVLLRALHSGETRSTRAGANGAFRFAGVPGGQAYTLTAGQSSRDLRVPPTGIAAVRLGEPLAPN